MHIESYEVSYPYEKIVPGERFSPHPFDFRLESKPDYSVMVVEVVWTDNDGTEHEEPLSQDLIDRAVVAGRTDEQTLKHLREFFAK